MDSRFQRMSISIVLLAAVMSFVGIAGARAATINPANHDFRVRVGSRVEFFAERPTVVGNPLIARIICTEGSFTARVPTRGRRQGGLVSMENVTAPVFAPSNPATCTASAGWTLTQKPTAVEVPPYRWGLNLYRAGAMGTRTRASIIWQDITMRVQRAQGTCTITFQRPFTSDKWINAEAQGRASRLYGGALRHFIATPSANEACLTGSNAMMLEWGRIKGQWKVFDTTNSARSITIDNP